MQNIYTYFGLTVRCDWIRRRWEQYGHKPRHEVQALAELK